MSRYAFLWFIGIAVGCVAIFFIWFDPWLLKKQAKQLKDEIEGYELSRQREVMRLTTEACTPFLTEDQKQEILDRYAMMLKSKESGLDRRPDYFSMNGTIDLAKKKAGQDKRFAQLQKMIAVCKEFYPLYNTDILEDRRLNREKLRTVNAKFHARKRELEALLAAYQKEHK